MDEVVAAVQFRDYVLVFTKHGKVYKILHDDSRLELTVHLMIDMFPK